MSQIAVIGAGAWGTALSIVLGRNGSHRIRLWAHDSSVCENMRRSRINDDFLPGWALPEPVDITDDLSDALARAQIVVSAVPSQHCRQIFERMCPHLRADILIASATKGLEENTLRRMSEVATEVIQARNGYSPRIGALSGPSFAVEVARGDPTAVTIASVDDGLARTVQEEFGDARFRVYTNSDITGVELGGALKNVVAIAAGICAGLGLGHNSIASLITRGLAEITRLVVACGGRAETMAGLAGLGDLVLTCTGGLSRNRSVGVELGRGRALPEIIASMHGKVAEGVFTSTAAAQLAHARGIEMPITQEVNAILHQGKSPQDAIQELMMRSGKSEGD
jgi:glycerol-3-phosphate dehydrogenase (NAD(P)+)